MPSATIPGASRGGSAPVRPNVQVVHKPGGEIHRSPGGQIYGVRARGMEISHGPGGSRTVAHAAPGGLVIVSNQNGHGYVEHPYAYIGGQFVRRTYSAGGVTSTRFYQQSVYYGEYLEGQHQISTVPLDVYAPAAFYGPAFYAWAYNPWAAQFAYEWDWANEPWFSYFSPYFTPYRVYRSPALWLTDYLLSWTLQAAYQERSAEPDDAEPADALAQPAGTIQAVAADPVPARFIPTAAPLTPDVKQAVAEEVRRQIALENSEANAGSLHAPDPDSSGVPRILADDTAHVFVVSAPLDLDSNAGECSVTEGDVLQLNPPTPPAATAVQLTVLASKGQDCRKGAMVWVGVADLQEMQNHMREGIDGGLGELKKRQGHEGFPAAPAAASQPPERSGWSAAAPPRESNVVAVLTQQTKDADQAERDLLKPESASPASASEARPPAATANLIGKSPDQVKAALGKPNSVVDLGTKKIYVFENRRVTFTNGKVTDVQ